MRNDVLYAPWRMDYIRNVSGRGDEDRGKCFLCEASAGAGDDHDRARLILWRTDHTIVMINRFPYANGHLLVSPRAHKAELDDLSADELADLGAQTARAIRVLRRGVSAQGFNVGINLGRCAGAGVPGHLHQHVVPRWAGDINFISVVGEVRIVPQAMSQLWEELRKTAGEVP